MIAKIDLSDRREEIVLLRSRGYGWVAIAEELGVSTSTAHKEASRMGIKDNMGKRELYWRRLEEQYGLPIEVLLKRKHRAVGSWARVASALGVTEATVITWRKALGMKINGKR